MDHKFNYVLKNSDENIKCTSNKCNVNCNVKESSTILNKKQKTSTSIENQNHDCLLCKRPFISNSELMLHITFYHDSGSCPYCKKSYKHTLNNHINSVHLDMSELKCKYCALPFNGFLNLQQHIITEHTIENFQKTCNICNEKFPYFRELKNHQQEVHNMIPKFQCELCDYGADSNGLLQAHMNNKHNFNSNKPIILTEKCPKCFEFVQSKNLNHHLSSVHAKRNLKCNLCKKKFKTGNALKNHKYLVHNLGGVIIRKQHIGSYPCSHCHYRFKNEGTILSHYNSEHAPCICDLCNRKLLGKHSMKKHLEYSHGMKEKLYPCKKCNHKALTRGRLMKHVEVWHKKKKSAKRL